MSPQPQKEITASELQLLETLRNNVGDLRADKRLLETRNLVRFLRARSHSLENAEAMFRKYHEWRETNDIDHILEWNMPPEYNDYWRWYFTGFDRIGNPVIMQPVGSWNAAKVGEVGYDIFIRYGYHTYECIWTFMQRMSAGQSMYKQFTLVLDIKHLGWKTISTIDAMQGVLESIKTYEACFPETLHKAYIVNAPGLFSIVWKLVKPFISKETHEKIKFLSGSNPNAWREEICSVIEPGNLPVQYGGDLPNSVKRNMESYLPDATKEVKTGTKSENIISYENGNISILS